MVKAVRIHRTGGPEALVFEEIKAGEPGRGEVLVRQTAVGLNYIDTYQRTGLYPVPALPYTLGMEAAGAVEAVGPEVEGLKEGDRVAYAGGPPGAYCDARVMPADRLLKVPDTLADRQAAAMMLKGMTAEYLLRRTYRVKAGEVILFHAAAGGVGLIACQWAKHLGATVIGTVSTPEKAALAKAHGCDYPIVTSEEDFVARVREITDGAGAAVVYESIGKDTFAASLDCLAARGLMVLFGQSSGPVPPFDLGQLALKGSLFITRPILMTYTATRALLEASAAALFEVVATGKVKIEIGQTYALKDTAQAHRDLEARRTTGSTVLLP